MVIRTIAGYSLSIPSCGSAATAIAQMETEQNAETLMSKLIAEELEVPPEQVRVEHAGVRDKRYQSMGQSTPARIYWEPLRRAGITARMLLVSAAAEEWGVSPTQCRAERGAVVEISGSRRAAYGALVDLPALPPVPIGVPFKHLMDVSDLRTRGVIFSCGMDESAAHGRCRKSEEPCMPDCIASEGCTSGDSARICWNANLSEATTHLASRSQTTARSDAAGAGVSVETSIMSAAALDPLFHETNRPERIGRIGWPQRLARRVSRFRQHLLHKRDMKRRMAELMRLDDRLLRDVGIDRGEIAYVARHGRNRF